MKEKIVIKVTINGEKSRSRSKILKIVAGVSGVQSVKIQGDKDEIEVVGDGVDAVQLIKLLRKKVCPADLVSVFVVDSGKTSSSGLTDLSASSVPSIRRISGDLFTMSVPGIMQISFDPSAGSVLDLTQISTGLSLDLMRNVSCIQGLPDDGYLWRNYGMKSSPGMEFPISFYKCNSAKVYGCNVRKKVKWSIKGIFTITCSGKHKCRPGSKSDPSLSIHVYRAPSFVQWKSDGDPFIEQSRSGRTCVHPKGGSRVAGGKSGLCNEHARGTMCKIDGCPHITAGQDGLCISHRVNAPEENVKNICCDKCGKWRRLPLGTNPDVLSAKCECSMLNWLPEMNNSSFTEEFTTNAVDCLGVFDIAKNPINSLGHSGKVLSGLDQVDACHSLHSAKRTEDESGLMSERKMKEAILDIDEADTLFGKNEVQTETASEEMNSEVESESENSWITSEDDESGMSEINEDGMFSEIEEETLMIKVEHYLMQGGLGLTEPPKVEEWERAKEIQLTDNELSKLPENPNCPVLLTLLLQRNLKLRNIPVSFFEYMPRLEILNLSRTRIKSLPESLFSLINLKQLFLNNCELLMSTSPKVGQLKNLEVLDLQGTEIMELPKEVKYLTQLKCLRVSFYGCMNRGGRSEQSNILISSGIISSLSHLEELSIEVKSDDLRWDLCVEAVLSEVCSLTRLNALKFHFPRIELLRNCLRFDARVIFQSLPEFRFIVGHHAPLIMSRLPCDVEFELARWDRYLKYVNGASIPTDLLMVLQNADAFFLERHTSITKMSSFGVDNMNQLKACVLGECNELQVIVHEGDIHTTEHISSVLNSMEYLYVFRMKNFSSIWEGLLPNNVKCLSHLKFLTLHTCPRLTTVFTQGLLENLNNLEEVTVEDCSAITSLVSCQRVEILLPARYALPRLRKISLNYVPELISINSDVPIAPKLEWISIYGCPKLKSLPVEDISSGYLKKIKGERSWWEALEWGSNRAAYLDDIFLSY